MQLTLGKIALIYIGAIGLAYAITVDDKSTDVAAVINTNTATYMANPGTKKARYYGSIACVGPEYVQEVIAAPGKGEAFVLSRECVQKPAEPVVLYRDKGKDVTQVMFPGTGTQLFVPSTSIK
ncbi:hypothetical protein ADT27_13475 [Xanthomonas oryzae]|uniref:hypothetical protein n=1 Tax=Xanthomonas oryzae TaxID=347 RepID=UPI0006AC2F37|nr:hypothetical protein [Xanthomonas oryzae]KOR45000.1 hypothetical protein ADT27_13475 [Xanthomonas oryzae]